VITLQSIADNPSLVTSKYQLKSGEAVVFRPLNEHDVLAFGRFMEELSEEIRRRFGPHPLNSEEAARICDKLDDLKMLRMILVNSNDEIVGYIILSFELRDSQVLRYEDYKIPIERGRDICVAPAVADRYQNSGLGSIMLEETIKIAQRLGVKYIILWQGTQLTNTRAIHFYEKFGFQKSGEFEKYGNNNVDMTLML